MIVTFSRRRFRFSLRTLFAIFTLFGCWLGYEMNWIRQRHLVVGDPKVLSSAWHYATSQLTTGQTITRVGYELAPWPLIWLGEPGCSNILLAVGTSAEELGRVRRLFPEAGVEVNEP